MTDTECEIRLPDCVNHREAAIEWMRDNMNVVRLFEEFGTQLVSRGRYFGINLLRERVRWETIFSYGTEYKFCNSYSPFVARYLLCKHPEWKPFMRCKLACEETVVTYICDNDLGLVAA